MGSSFAVHTFDGLKLRMLRGWRSAYSSGLGHFSVVTTHRCLDCLGLTVHRLLLSYLFGAASSFMILCLWFKALSLKILRFFFAPHRCEASKVHKSLGLKHCFI